MLDSLVAFFTSTETQGEDNRAKESQTVAIFSAGNLTFSRLLVPSTFPGPGWSVSPYFSQSRAGRAALVGHHPLPAYGCMFLSEVISGARVIEVRVLFPRYGR